MAKDNRESSGFVGFLGRCWPALLVGLVLGAFVAGLFLKRPVTENTCDWPNVPCEAAENRTARVLLDGFLSAAEEALQRAHIDEGRRNEIRHLVERAKDPDLRNKVGWHVCVVQNPHACEELAQIAEDVRAAQQAADPQAATPLWDKAIEGLREFPSGM